MAIQLRNAAQYYKDIDPDVGGQLERLTSSLVGINERKMARQRQAEIDAMNAERQRQQMAAEEEGRQLRAVEFAQKMAALQPQKKEEVSFEDRGRAAAIPGKAPMDIPDTPEERAAFEAGGPVLAPVPPQSQQITIAGQTIDVPMLSRDEVQARGEEDFLQKLDQARRLEIAKGASEVTPEMIEGMPEQIRPFFQPGQLTEPPNPSSFLAAQARNTSDPFANVKGVAGGYLEVGPDGQLKFTRTAAEGGGADGRPTPTSLLNAQMDIGRSFQRYTTDAKTAGVQYGIVQNSLQEAKAALAQGRGIGPASQALITAFGRIIDPGSTVRESEYARTPEGLSLLHRIEGFYGRMRQGGAGLTIADLEDVEKASGAFMQGYINSQLNYAQLAKKQAEMIGKLSGGQLGDLSTILPPDTLNLLETGGQLPASGISPNVQQRLDKYK